MLAITIFVSLYSASVAEATKTSFPLSAGLQSTRARVVNTSFSVYDTLALVASALLARMVKQSVKVTSVKAKVNR